MTVTSLKFPDLGGAPPLHWSLSATVAPSIFIRMKLKFSILALAAASLTSAQAANKYWDTTAGSGNGVGGTGTWTASGTTIFSNAATGDAALSAAATTDTDIFQGTAGTVTLSANMTAAAFTFNTTNYKITGNSSTTRTLTGSISLAGNTNLTIGNGETTDIAIGMGSVSGTTGSTLTINGAASSGALTRLNLSTGTTPTLSVPVTVTGTGFAGISGGASGAQVTGTVTGNGSRLNLGATSGNSIAFTQKIDNGTATVRIAAGSSGGAGVVTLSGTGNAWGITEMNNAASGILRMGAINALPTATTLTYGVTSGNGDSIIELAGKDTAIGQLTNGIQSGGILRNTSATAATLTLSGSDTLAAAFSGSIQDGTGGGALALVRSGTGTTTLGAANSYTGGTTISGGTLVLGTAADTLANTSTVTVSGGILSLGSNNDTVGAVTLSSGSITGTGTLTGSSYSLTDGGTISAKLGGAAALSKSGNGTATLSATNAYTGTTSITAGKLIVNGNISTSTLTTVSGTGTLGGSGMIGALTVSSGGTLAPGNSPGILFAGNTSLQATSTLGIEINGSTINTEYDQFNVTGTVSLAGLLAVSMTGYTPADNSLFFILANDSNDAISGTFSNAPTNGAVYNYDGQDFQISYFGNYAGAGAGTFTGGNDVVLMAIPEPTSALLGGLGMVALLRRRRC